MTHRPVGLSTSLSTTTASGMTTSFVVKSNALRIVAAGNTGAHVKIDSVPTATVFDYYIPAGGTATLAMTKSSNRVVGITTGNPTTITFPEGTQCPFGVGDYITITGGTNADLNLNHVKVLTVDVKSSYDGSYQTSCTVDIDTGTAGNFAGPDVTASISLRLAARTDSGTGTIHAQQVQISGNA